MKNNSYKIFNMFYLSEYQDIKIPKQCQLVIFDLDDTLKCRFTGKIFSDVKYILHFLRHNNIKMAIASLNMYANFLLDQDDMLHFFEDVQQRTLKTFRDYDKTPMFNNILEKLNIKSENTILFDDNFRHCIEASLVNMHYLEVNSERGLTLNNFKKGMSLFHQRRRSI
jgi:FMN phosphatase YigB (HAD superfamily)